MDLCVVYSSFLMFILKSQSNYFPTVMWRSPFPLLRITAVFEEVLPDDVSFVCRLDCRRSSQNPFRYVFWQEPIELLSNSIATILRIHHCKLSLFWKKFCLLMFLSCINWTCKWFNQVFFIISSDKSQLSYSPTLMRRSSTSTTANYRCFQWTPTCTFFSKAISFVRDDLSSLDIWKEITLFNNILYPLFETTSFRKCLQRSPPELMRKARIEGIEMVRWLCHDYNGQH